jgi:FKBP-type peptidyl-prolyl cis-trans isomerase
MRVLPAVLTLLGVAACDRSSDTPKNTVEEAAPEPSSGFAAELRIDTMALTTAPSGLRWLDVTVGEGKEAKAGHRAEVHYTGWLTNGQKFDSSRDGGTPFSFNLGAGQVIKGWDEGVAGMKVGGRRKLVIPAALGYGDAGAPPDIPGGATLVFDVELLGVQ